MELDATEVVMFGGLFGFGETGACCSNSCNPAQHTTHEKTHHDYHGMHSAAVLIQDQ
jgi:hypothetical protein